MVRYLTRVPVDPIRVLTELHGSAGLLAVAALIHPLALLRRPSRRAPLACWAATAATTAVFGGGLALYGTYRERVKHELFVAAPSIGWLFERKEHLALGALALAWCGAIAHALERRPGLAAPMRRLALGAYAAAAAMAAFAAVAGLVVAAVRPM